jgi:hypothetical protein
VLAVEAFDALGDGCDGDNLVSQQFEDVHERGAGDRIILDNEDALATALSLNRHEAFW